MDYFPQFAQGTPYKRGRSGAAYSGYGRHDRIETDALDGRRFPRDVLTFSHSSERGLHPTQKPVALFEYLIRTYTQPGALVFDPFVGSGTTALAARATGRHYICGDLSPDYVAIALDRLRLPFEPRHVRGDATYDDLPLFAKVEGE